MIKTNALSDEETVKQKKVALPVNVPIEKKQAKKQILFLDGVRGLAAFAVVCFHLNLFIRNAGIWKPEQTKIKYLEGIVGMAGETGVVLFFLLSSFLLFLPFAKALLFGGPWPDTIRYYLRRIFRIVPAYYVTVILIALFFHPEFLLSDHHKYLKIFFTFQMEFALSQFLNGPFWTLAVEFQFYLALPLLALALKFIVQWGSVKWRLIRLTLCMILIVIWNIALRYWDAFYANTSKFDFFVPHALAMKWRALFIGESGHFYEVFAVGMLLAMLYVYVQQTPVEARIRHLLRFLSVPMFVAGLAVLAGLSLWHYFHVSVDVDNYIRVFNVFPSWDKYTRVIILYWNIWEGFTGAIGYGLCLCALCFGANWLRFPFEWSVLRSIGKISFSLYMWHLQFIILFFNSVLPNLNAYHYSHAIVYLAAWAWVILLAFSVSATFYRWVEEPGVKVGEVLIKYVQYAQNSVTAMFAKKVVSHSSSAHLISQSISDQE